MQEQKNNITEVIHIGGFVRLVFTIPTTSLLSATMVTGAATMRTALPGSLQLSELHNNADIENYKFR